MGAIGLLYKMEGSVREQIDGLATANSDSTQWSLAQLDVEMLALKAAIFTARADPAAELVEVRNRFNVLYSRINTVSSSPLYAPLRANSDAADALARIDRYLNETVTLIDGDDAGLRRALVSLETATEAIRPNVRQITLSGVSILARQADMQRRAIADTLHLVSTLSVVSFVLFVLLLGLLLHLVTRARKRAEDQRIVRSRLAAIISTSLDAVLVVNRHGWITDRLGRSQRWNSGP